MHTYQLRRRLGTPVAKRLLEEKNIPIQALEMITVDTLSPEEQAELLKQPSITVGFLVAAEDIDGASMTLDAAIDEAKK